MTTDKIRYNLLFQACLPACLIEDALELSELTERRFAHKFEHFVACVFGCDFQSSADMFGDKFFCVISVRFIKVLVFPVV